MYRKQGFSEKNHSTVPAQQQTKLTKYIFDIFICGDQKKKSVNIGFTFIRSSAMLMLKKI